MFFHRMKECIWERYPANFQPDPGFRAVDCRIFRISPSIDVYFREVTLSGSGFERIYASIQVAWENSMSICDPNVVG